MNKRILSYSIVGVGFFYGFDTVIFFGIDLPKKQSRHNIAKALGIAHSTFQSWFSKEHRVIALNR